MTSGQHAEQPPAKRRGPKPASRIGAAGGDRALGGRGLPQGLGSASGRRDRSCPKRVLRLMRDMPHRSWRHPHDGEPHAPNLMWGTDGVRVPTVDDGWGWPPPSSIGTVCRLACKMRSALWISMGLAGLAHRSGAGLADGSVPLSDHFTNQDQVPSNATPSSPMTASPSGSIAAEGTDHPWSHLPQHRGAAGRRPRLRELYRVDRRKERLPERSSSSGVARRDLNQARRVRQICVQGTGSLQELAGSPLNAAPALACVQGDTLHIVGGVTG